MENDGLLTIRRLVFRGNAIKKKAMHLPVLSLHAEQSKRQIARYSRKKKSQDKMLEKKSISNILHIVEEPEICSSKYMMTSLNTRSAFSKDELFAVNRSVDMSSQKKRHISLPSQQCRGQLYHAMKFLLDKKKQQIKKSMDRGKDKSFKKGDFDMKRSFVHVDDSQRLVASKIKIFPSSSCRKVIPFNTLREHFKRNMKQDRKNLVVNTEKMVYGRKGRSQRKQQDLTGWNEPQIKEKILHTELAAQNIEYESLHF